MTFIDFNVGALPVYKIENDYFIECTAQTSRQDLEIHYLGVANLKSGRVERGRILTVCHTPQSMQDYAFLSALDTQQKE